MPLSAFHLKRQQQLGVGGAGRDSVKTTDSSGLGLGLGLALLGLVEVADKVEPLVTLVLARQPANTQNEQQIILLGLGTSSTDRDLVTY